MFNDTAKSLADPVMPVPVDGQFFCVIGRDALEVHGPYLTSQAAQSLLDEGVIGRIVRMRLD